MKKNFFKRLKMNIKIIKQNIKINKVNITIEMRFGSPGSGKTTDLVRQALYYIKIGLPVFSNVALAIPGVYELDMNDLGRCLFPSCVILIDEASLSGIDNRSWKSFPKELLEFFKLHRHYKAKVIIYSQSPNDCDKKIRDLQNYSWYISRSIIPGFSVCRKYVKRLGINEEETDFVMKLKKSFIIGGISYYFRPFYYRFFDSYSLDYSKYQVKEFNKYVPDDTKIDNFIIYSVKQRIKYIKSLFKNITK